jgi:two-component system chemotaxis response regulator CheB
MFTSAAEAYGPATIGVILTGANEDGARGLADIVKRGGCALIQDPKTAEIKIMPESALKATPGAEVLSLDNLAPRLIGLSGEAVEAGRRKAV